MKYNVAIAENEEVNTAICFAAALGNSEEAARIAAENGCEIVTFDSFFEAGEFIERTEAATASFLAK